MSLVRSNLKQFIQQRRKEKSRQEWAKPSEVEFFFLSKNISSNGGQEDEKIIELHVGPKPHEIFKVEEAVLTCCSLFFYTLFFSDCLFREKNDKRVVLEHIGVEVMREVIRFANLEYENNLNSSYAKYPPTVLNRPMRSVFQFEVKNEILLHLHFAAQFFGISELLDLTAKMLADQVDNISHYQILDLSIDVVRKIFSRLHPVKLAILELDPLILQLKHIADAQWIEWMNSKNLSPNCVFLKQSWCRFQVKDIIRTCIPTAKQVVLFDLLTSTLLKLGQGFIRLPSYLEGCGWLGDEPSFSFSLQNSHEDQVLRELKNLDFFGIRTSQSVPISIFSYIKHVNVVEMRYLPLNDDLHAILKDLKPESLLLDSMISKQSIMEEVIIHGFNGVEIMQISNSNWEGKILAELGSIGCKMKLRALSLWNNDMGNREWALLVDLLVYMPGLEILDLGKNNIDLRCQVNWQNIRDLQNLKVLLFSYNQINSCNIDMNMTSLWEYLPMSLEVLALDDTRIDYCVVDYINENMKYLDMSGTSLDSIESIGENWSCFPQLEILDISNIQLNASILTPLYKLILNCKQLKNIIANIKNIPTPSFERFEQEIRRINSDVTIGRIR